MFYSFDIFPVISRASYTLDFFKFFKKFNNINPREEINFFSTIIVFTITNQAIIPLWNTGQSDFLLLRRKKKNHKEKKGKKLWKKDKAFTSSVSFFHFSLRSKPPLSLANYLNFKRKCKILLQVIQPWETPYKGTDREL